MAVRTPIMNYLGGISGYGTLKSEGKEVGRAFYDLDGFYKKGLGVVGSGEVQVSATSLREIFGRKDVQLVTDDGRLLDLKFSEKNLSLTGDVAHVDVTGQFPPKWRDSHY
jgi:hypothetical protein